MFSSSPGGVKSMLTCECWEFLKKEKKKRKNHWRGQFITSLEENKDNAKKYATQRH